MQSLKGYSRSVDFILSAKRSNSSLEVLKWCNLESIYIEVFWWLCENRLQRSKSGSKEINLEVIGGI